MSEPIYKNCLQSFIDFKTDLDMPNQFGVTPFWYCYKENKQELALFLAEKGANVNLRDNYGWFVMKHEVMKGNADLMLKLIQRGADVETRDELERSSLHLAFNNFKEGSHL